MRIISLLSVFALILLGTTISSCSSLKSASSSVKTEVSKIDVPPNVSSNKLSKKRLKN